MKEISPYSQQRVIRLDPEDVFPGQSRLDAAEAPSLGDYWRVARKHQWKILACLGAAVAVSAVVVFSMKPVYTARTTLLIERKEPQVVNIKQVLAESADAEAGSYYESQYQVLKSRSLAAEVIKAEGLDNHPAFTGAGEDGNSIAQLWVKTAAWLKSFLPQPPPARSGDLGGVSSRLIDAYAGMLDVEPVKRSRLVKIAFSAPDAALAARVANAHAGAYIRHGFALRNQANEEARKFLETKLAELKNRVEESENTLNDFRRQKGIVSLDDKENIVVDRLADLNRRLTEAQAERIGLEAHAHLIKRRQYDSLPAVINNSLIQSLSAQVVQLEAEHAKLSAQFLPGYPRLAQAKAQLEESRSRLNEQIRSVVEGINSAHLAAAGKERALKMQMDKQKSDALALKDASVEYSILAREADTNRQLYESVLERLKEISVAGGIPTANVSILDRAEIPQQPAKPSKRLNLMLGALLGLLGGLGLALVLERFDKTLKTPGEIERCFGLPTLAVVADFFSLPRGRRPRLSLLHHRPAHPDAALCWPGKTSLPGRRRVSVITEAYRKLRTAIFLSGSEKPPKTILFTSGTAGEGKTMTVANTAIMLARLRYRTLVIDADLRRPSCGKALKVQSARGLADYLRGSGELEEMIRATSIPNLSVLNCGSLPQNPTELIDSKQMQHTLALLKEHYDFILIDSPPILPVSDAIVLSSMAEGLIFIVRGQKTPRHVVREALSQLGNNQLKILGVVLNRVDVRSADYGDYYQFHDPEYYEARTT